MVLCVVCSKFYFSSFIILDNTNKLILRCDGQSRKDYRFAFRENTANPRIPNMGQGGRFCYFIGKCFGLTFVLMFLSYFNVINIVLCESFSSF